MLFLVLRGAIGLGLGMTFGFIPLPRLTGFLLPVPGLIGIVVIFPLPGFVLETKPFGPGRGDFDLFIMLLTLLG
jgi:hypothetical protein